MKLKAFLSLFLVGLSFIFASVKSEDIDSVYFIAIDAGHGGYDPGACTNGIKESEINLEIAKALENIFVSNGYSVIMTRDKDIDFSPNIFIKRTDINQRINIINSSLAEVNISIHLNAYANSIYKGAQVFYANANEKNCLLAKFVQKSLGYYLGTTRKEVERSNIYLLNKLYNPSILVECGFMTNKEEMYLMQKKEYQYHIAYAIYRGILDYKEKEAAKTAS